MNCATDAFCSCKYMILSLLLGYFMLFNFPVVVDRNGLFLMKQLEMIEGVETLHEYSLN